MRSFTLLALVAIVATSLAVNLSPKQNAFLAISNDLKNNNSPMALTISSLLAVHQVTLDASVVDNSQVVNALDVLRNELEDILSQTQELYETATQRHNTEAAQLDQHEATVQDNLVANQAALGDAEEELAQTEAKIAQDEAQLEDTRNQITEADNLRAVENAQYVQHTADINDALEAIAEAIEIVHEIANRDLTTVGFEAANAFLQTSTNKIKAAMKKVEARLNRSNRGTIVAPFFKALAQIMQDGVNAEVTGQIVNLLNGLTADLTTERQNIADLEAQRLAAYEVLIAQLNALVDSLQTSIANGYQKRDQLQAEIARLEEVIANLQQDLVNVQAAIAQEAANWEKTAAAYEQRISRAQSDLALLERAISRLAQEGATKNE